MPAIVLAEHLLQPDVLGKIFEEFSEFSHIGLAVSGGADSVALMRLAALWVANRRAAGFECPVLTALSVDHRLRAESRGEVRLVEAWAEEIEIAHTVLVWDGEKPEKGLQEAARDARYGLLCEWGKAQEVLFEPECGSSVRVAVAVGHHLTDQAETVLMRLARGSGADGLASMRPVLVRDGISILRPLLGVAKKQLVELLLEHFKVPWIEDPSNQSTAYERVRIRGERERLAALGLSDSALALTAGRMARVVEALEGATTRFMVEDAGYQPYLPLGIFVWPWPLKDVAFELIVRGIGRVLKAVGGQDEMPSLAAIERLAQQLNDSGFAGATLGGCQLTLGGQDVLGGAGVDSGILVHREVGRDGLPEIVLRPGEEVIWDGRFRVRAQAVGKWSEELKTDEAGIIVRGVDELALMELAGSPMQLLSRAGRASLPPRSLWHGLPAFWHGDQLVAIPSIGLESRNGPGGFAREDDQWRDDWRDVDDDKVSSTFNAQVDLRKEAGSDGFSATFLGDHLWV